MKEWIVGGVVWLMIVGVIYILVDAPIFKPWFGFRKPNGHRGRWFQ